jgi:hypothetical protein
MISYRVLIFYSPAGLKAEVLRVHDPAFIWNVQRIPTIGLIITELALRWRPKIVAD